MKISAPFTPTKWDEADYGPIHEGTKTTKASVEYTFSDPLSGVATVEYLMFYSAFDPNDMHAAEASFVGIIRFTGSLLGKSGTFTLQESGTFSGGVVNSTLRILAGSGIGELKALSGSGTSIADSNGAKWDLEISI